HRLSDGYAYPLEGGFHLPRACASTLTDAVCILEQALVLEVGEHGQDTPVVVLRLAEPQLAEDVGRVLADGLLTDEQLRGDRGVGAALGHEPQDLLLAGGERIEPV